MGVSFKRETSSRFASPPSGDVSRSAIADGRGSCTTERRMSSGQEAVTSAADVKTCRQGGLEAVAEVLGHEAIDAWINAAEKKDVWLSVCLLKIMSKQK